MADEKNSLPPFTADISLDLIQAVEKAERVSDMDISALAFIARYGTCSTHGAVSDEVEVSSGATTAAAYIRCPGCRVMGITRRCPVEAVGPVEREIS